MSGRAALAIACWLMLIGLSALVALLGFTAWLVVSWVLGL